VCSSDLAEKEPRRAGKAQQQTQQPRLPGQSAGAGCRRGKGAGGKTHRPDCPVGGPGSLSVSKVLSLPSPLCSPTRLKRAGLHGVSLLLYRESPYENSKRDETTALWAPGWAYPGQGREADFFDFPHPSTHVSAAECSGSPRPPVSLPVPPFGPPHKPRPLYSYLLHQKWYPPFYYRNNFYNTFIYSY